MEKVKQIDKQKEQTRHMTEERDFLPEKKRTAEMTGLSINRIEKFLEEGVTHSELRMGEWEMGTFKPGNFNDSLFAKKECKTIPINKIYNV